MRLKIISDQIEWTTYFNDVGSPSFHQSWEWGEFQKAQGTEILRLGFYNNKIQGIALVLKVRSRRGNYLFIPHGPLFDIKSHDLAVTVPSHHIKQIKEYLRLLTDYLTQIARDEGFSYIRIAPVLTDISEHKEVFSEIGYRTAPIYIHAETMWALDITLPEYELLNNMRKTTRYLIRQGIKNGISIKEFQTIDAFESFWKLYEATYTREHFTPFPSTYIQNEFNAFHKYRNSSFFLGEAPPKFAQEGASPLLAGSLVVFTKSSAFYHQGASVHTRYPVPYVLQWQSILSAKSRGCTFYNFYGIYHPGRTPRSWQGLTLFKKGFGGFEVRYLPTQDYIISPRYFISFLIDRYVAWRRGI